jgi:hypothetical protein
MRRVVGLLAAVTGICAALSPPARAQVGYLWSYEELLQKADLVVIAECESTLDTGRRRPHPGPKPSTPVAELQTVFRISAVLKSPHPVPVGANLRLRHYRFTPEVLRHGLLNAGSWLRLQAQRHYLLFLTNAAGGVYEPLSGPTFPTDSVYLLDPSGP